MTALPNAKSADNHAATVTERYLGSRRGDDKLIRCVSKTNGHEENLRVESRGGKVSGDMSDGCIIVGYADSLDAQWKTSKTDRCYYINSTDSHQVER